MGGYRNWDPGTCGKHQGKNEKFLVCRGPIGAEIGTLGPQARLRVLILDYSVRVLVFIQGSASARRAVPSKE